MFSDKKKLYHLKYRPDIDGLRALAVLSVVICHAFPSFLMGGFTGVDVFFVISGYLITTTIAKNIENNTFSFFDFYARRIKRIFPSLIVVLFFCLLFGWYVLFPFEYKQLGKYIFGGAGFFANYLFYQDVGYFDNSAETKPVLHLWSLGVEEQFYIIWPLMIYILYKRNINILSFSVFVLILSFIFNIKMSRVNMAFDFYSVFTRFWEITSGSVLSLFFVYKTDISNHIKQCCGRYISIFVFNKQSKDYVSVFNDVVSLFGIAILVYGFIKVSSGFRFPGFWSLLPISGSLIIIFSGENSLVNKNILSNKILVWFGVISFPLYLWHWPLLSFSRIINGGEVSVFLRIFIVFLSIFLAWATYAWIEKPLRFKKYTVGSFIPLVGVMMSIGMFGFVDFKTNGVMARLSSQGKKVTIAQTDGALLVPEEGYQNCSEVFPDWGKNTGMRCFMQKKSGLNTVAVIGDSHAAHLLAGLTRQLPAAEGVVSFPGSCAAPFIDVATATKEKALHDIRKNAYRFIDYAYDYIVNDQNIKTVILAHDPQCSYSDSIDMEDESIVDPGVVMGNGFRRTIEKLEQAHKKIILMWDNPTLPYSPTACSSRDIFFAKDGEKCSFPKKEWSEISAYGWYKSTINAQKIPYKNIIYYDSSNNFCDDEVCYVMKNGNILFFDTNHLNLYGSLYVAKDLVEVIEKGVVK